MAEPAEQGGPEWGGGRCGGQSRSAPPRSCSSRPFPMHQIAMLGSVRAKRRGGCGRARAGRSGGNPHRGRHDIVGARSLLAGPSVVNRMPRRPAQDDQISKRRGAQGGERARKR